MKRVRLLLVFVFLIALVLRVLSLQWNVIPHGDIEGDVIAVASFLREQRLIDSYDPPETPPYFFPPGRHNLLLSHPPIWALLGAGLSFVLRFQPTEEAAFLALKILSVMSGMLIIFLAAWIAWKRINRVTGIAIAVWLSFSYMMVDYSGNGALYSLQTAVYLLWIIVAYTSLKRKAVWLGVVSGLGYLVNHQAAVLAIASVIILLLATDRSWKQRFIDLMVVTLVTLVVTSPWLIRNYVLFGDSFFSHLVNASYVYKKAGIFPVDVDGRSVYVFDLAQRMRLFQNIFLVWLPNNLYYIARKFFILAPIMFVLFSFAWIEYSFSSKRLRAMAPVVVLFVLHLFVSAGWPVAKFRYLLPMLPLVFLISLEQLYSLRLGKRLVAVILTATTCAIIVLSFLTYYTIPTHTYYYDGAITNDPFKAKGEFNYMQKKGFIPAE